MCTRGGFKCFHKTKVVDCLNGSNVFIATGNWVKNTLLSFHNHREMFGSKRALRGGRKRALLLIGLLKSQHRPPPSWNFNI